MKLRNQIIVGVALAFVQGMISQLLGYNEFIPNAILIVTIVGVFSTEDTMKWIIIGWTATVLRDLGASLFPGSMTVSTLLAICACIFLKKWISNENIFGIIINVILGIVIYYSAYWAISKLAGSPYTYVYAASTWALQIPLSIVLGLVVYHFIARTIKEKRRKERFRKYL